MNPQEISFLKQRIASKHRHVVISTLNQLPISLETWNSLLSRLITTGRLSGVTEDSYGELSKSWISEKCSNLVLNAVKTGKLSGDVVLQGLMESGSLIDSECLYVVVDTIVNLCNNSKTQFTIRGANQHPLIRLSNSLPNAPVEQVFLARLGEMDEKEFKKWQPWLQTSICLDRCSFKLLDGVKTLATRTPSCQTWLANIVNTVPSTKKSPQIIKSKLDYLKRDVLQLLTVLTTEMSPPDMHNVITLLSDVKSTPTIDLIMVYILSQLILDSPSEQHVTLPALKLLDHIICRLDSDFASLASIISLYPRLYHSSISEGSKVPQVKNLSEKPPKLHLNQELPLLLHQYHHGLESIVATWSEKTLPISHLLIIACTSHPNPSTRLQAWKHGEWTLDHLPLFLYKLEQETDPDVLNYILIEALPSLVNVQDPIATARIARIATSFLDPSKDTFSTGLTMMRHCYERQSRLWPQLKQPIQAWIASKSTEHQAAVMSTLFQALNGRREALAEELLPICIDLLETNRLSDPIAFAFAISCINVCISINVTDPRAIYNIVMNKVLEKYQSSNSPEILDALSNYLALVGDGCTLDDSEKYLEFAQTVINDYIWPGIPKTLVSLSHFPESMFQDKREEILAQHDPTFFAKMIELESTNMPRSLFRGLGLRQESTPATQGVILAENYSTADQVSQSIFNTWKSGSNASPGLKSGLAVSSLFSSPILSISSREATRDLMIEIAPLLEKEVTADELFASLQPLLTGELNRTVTYGIRDINTTLLGDHLIATRYAITGAFRRIYKSHWPMLLETQSDKIVSWFIVRITHNFVNQKTPLSVANSAYALGGLILSLKDFGYSRSHVHAGDAVDTLFQVLGVNDETMLVEDSLASVVINLAWCATCLESTDEARLDKVIETLHHHSSSDHKAVETFSAMGLGLLLDTLSGKLYERVVMLLKDTRGEARGLSLAIAWHRLKETHEEWCQELIAEAKKGENKVGSAYLLAWANADAVDLIDSWLSCVNEKRDPITATHLCIAKAHLSSGSEKVGNKANLPNVVSTSSLFGFDLLRDTGKLSNNASFSSTFQNLLTVVMTCSDLKVARNAGITIGRLSTLIALEKQLDEEKGGMAGNLLAVSGQVREPNDLSRLGESWLRYVVESENPMSTLCLVSTPLPAYNWLPLLTSLRNMEALEFATRHASSSKSCLEYLLTEITSNYKNGDEKWWKMVSGQSLAVLLSMTTQQTTLNVAESKVAEVVGLLIKNAPDKILLLETLSEFFYNASMDQQAFKLRKDLASEVIRLSLPNVSENVALYRLFSECIMASPEVLSGYLAKNSLEGMLVACQVLQECYKLANDSESAIPRKHLSSVISAILKDDVVPVWVIKTLETIYKKHYPQDNATISAELLKIIDLDLHCSLSARTWIPSPSPTQPRTVDWLNRLLDLTIILATDKTESLQAYYSRVIGSFSNLLWGKYEVKADCILLSHLTCFVTALEENNLYPPEFAKILDPTMTKFNLDSARNQVVGRLFKVFELDQSSPLRPLLFATIDRLTQDQILQLVDFY